MTNWSFTGKEISKKLDNKTIQNGGLQIVTMPIAKVSNDEVDTIEFGGYNSIVHYNKDRETQYKQDKSNKSFRKLRRHVKNLELRKSGLTHNIIIQTYAAKDNIK